jgi:hypothetical protein
MVDKVADGRLAVGPRRRDTDLRYSVSRIMVSLLSHRVPR